jgi:hypothetical protein
MFKNTYGYLANVKYKSNVVCQLKILFQGKFLFIILIKSKIYVNNYWLYKGTNT